MRFADTSPIGEKHETPEKTPEETASERKTRFGVSPIGLPPGSMIHTGEKTDEKVYMTAYMYNEDQYEKKELDSALDLVRSVKT